MLGVTNLLDPWRDRCLHILVAGATSPAAYMTNWAITGPTYRPSLGMLRWPYTGMTFSWASPCTGVEVSSYPVRLSCSWPLS